MPRNPRKYQNVPKICRPDKNPLLRGKPGAKLANKAAAGNCGGLR